MRIKNYILNFIENNNGFYENDKFYNKEYLKKIFLVINKKILSLPKNEIFAISHKDKLIYFISILSCMYCSRTFTPLSNTWPKKFIKKIKRICEVKYDINEKFLKKKILLKTKKNSKKKQKINTLYILFTSGSTGEPKGCEIPRNAYLNFLKWIKKDLNGINPSMKILFNTNFTFDVSLMEVGLAIIFRPKIYHLSNGNILQLLDFITKKKINLICAVPNLIGLLISKDIRKKGSLSSLHSLFIAGSQFSSGLLSKLKATKDLKNTKVYNCYGPTEATIYCAYKKLNLNREFIFQGNVSIGKELPGNKFIIQKDLNNKKKITGELLISGSQLMSGYKNRLELTNAAFVYNKGIKFYKSGDLAAKIKGEFYILGRLDDTIKSSGHRINLSFIDNNISKYKYSVISKTISIKDKIRENIVISFIVTNKKVSTDKIYSYLKTVLPEYHLPHRIILKKKLPQNTSGKVSSKELIKKLG